MNSPSLTTFTSKVFGAIRIIDQGGEPWFVAYDIANILGYAKPENAIARHCKAQTTTPKQGGGFLTIIPERDLYRLVMRSKLPAAEQFEDWVVGEVLPSIRKNGIYASPDFIESALADPETMIRTLQALKNEREKRQLAEQKIQIQAPKVLFADAVSSSTSSILVGEFAKILRQNGIHTGQNRFFSWLREKGYLVKRQGSDYNMPTQRSMEMSLFEIKERTIVNPDGSTRITKTSKMTGKGQQYFINLFLGQVSGLPSETKGVMP